MTKKILIYIDKSFFTLYNLAIAKRFAFDYDPIRLWNEWKGTMTLFYQERKQLCVWLVVCGVVAVMLTGSTPSATAEGSTDRTSIPSNRSALSQTSLTNTSL